MLKSPKRGESEDNEELPTPLPLIWKHGCPDSPFANGVESKMERADAGAVGPLAWKVNGGVT